MTKLISTNPGKNYEVIGEVEMSTEQEIIEKFQKAKAAKKAWKDMGLKKRVELLTQVHDKISAYADELALISTRETGKPISQGKSDVVSGLEFFKWYLDNAEKYLTPETIFEDESTKLTVHREPYGVVAVIVPWNFPFSNFIWGGGQHLIAGSSIILKHSEECPLFSKKLEEIILSCDLPEGVFSAIYGDGKSGQLLVEQDINFISFTGSTKTGSRLYQIAAEKLINVSLELGGSAPGIIFEDADIDKVLATTIYENRFGNCGQMCDALKRLIVHESKFDEVVSKLTEYLKTKKIGDTEDSATDIGPLVAARQLELLQAQAQDAIDKGATPIYPISLDEQLKGAFFAPAVITNVSTDMRIWKEEVFGPILPIITFKTEEEAIILANDTPYGLGAFIFTEDKKRAGRLALELESGMVGINNVNYVQPMSPFGGYKQSGIGREHGKYGFDHVTQVKVVASEK